MRHWTGTAFLSQKKRYTTDRSLCRDIRLAWEWYAPNHRLRMVYYAGLEAETKRKDDG